MLANRIVRMMAMAVMAILFIALGGYVVMRLWNWLLPPLFAWHTVTFWQSLGLLLLCRILFGRLGGSGMARSDARRRIKERFQQMSPEERERFRHGMRGRCGSFGNEPTAEAKP
jgi:hypothetical protein